MVIWSEPAIDDLNSVFNYIAKDSRYYAEKLFETAIGKVVPEQKNRKIREVFVYSYRMIYQISNSDIEIIAFVHGARDLTTEEFQNLMK
ncbi:MAG: type II toxin-antitoxin system RelE/ParE family toxin [Bacteroidota bacterium]|nr:type II toxin-antitoxin system RelE/ParE family toxin [Bacteroidota bacterium]